MHNKWILFLKMFIDGLGFRDMLIANIKEFINSLDKEQETALLAQIDKFFKEI